LVTGFEPFGGHDFNISEAVARCFSGEKEISNPWTGDLIEVETEFCVLTVDEAGSLQIAQRLANGERWDAILHIGLCERCEIPRVERTARDLLDMRMPDNQGRYVTGATIDGEGHRGTWVDPTVWDASKFPVAFEVSTDAGAYLCNETYFQTLKQLILSSHTATFPSPCLFLHLPDVHCISMEDAEHFATACLAYLLFPAPPQSTDVVAAFLPLSNGHVVMKRALGGADGGMWEYPGGKCEPAESWREATVRELVEELEIDVIPQHPIGMWLRARGDEHFCIHMVQCEWSRDLDSISLNAHEAIAEVQSNAGIDGDWAGRDGEMYAHIKAFGSYPS
jgi:pyrrolidone-carboxylate peptidase/8-oxo-dGTP pyrophosphatase MutT (NUDIX family)